MWAHRAVAGRLLECDGKGDAGRAWLSWHRALQEATVPLLGCVGFWEDGVSLALDPKWLGGILQCHLHFFSFVWFSSRYIFQHLHCNTTSSSRMVALSEPPAPGSCPRGNHCPPRAGCTPGCCLEQGVPWLSCFVPGARTQGRRASAWGKVGSWGQSPWGKVDRWLCPEHTGSLPSLLPGP